MIHGAVVGALLGGFRQLSSQYISKKREERKQDTGFENKHIRHLQGLEDNYLVLYEKAAKKSPRIYDLVNHSSQQIDKVVGIWVEYKTQKIKSSSYHSVALKHFKLGIVSLRKAKSLLNDPITTAACNDIEKNVVEILEMVHTLALTS